MQFSEAEKGVLLLAARESIRSMFGEERRTMVDFNQYQNLLLRTGVFVTLTINKRLRGCIGYITSNDNVLDTVIEAAKHAAFDDPRFPKLTFNELPKIEIEISVLYPPYPIDDYNSIIIGKHGIILNEKEHRALLLPQVAIEHKMDLPQFLSALCEKAWLDPHEWQRRHLTMEVFETEVFSETGKRKSTYEH